MKSLRAPRLSLALLALASATSLAIAPAAAQAPATSTLTDVQLIAEGENQSVFQLSLSPRAGSYSAVNSDPSRPTLMLLRAASRVTKRSYRGLVRSVDYEPSDSGLAVKFLTIAPAKLEASPSGPRDVLITVTKLTGAEARGSRPVDSENEQVVAATGRPRSKRCPARTGSSW